MAASEVTRTAALVPALMAGLARSRRRVGAPAIAAIAAAALVACLPAESLAQTPSGNAATGPNDLLQPSFGPVAALPDEIGRAHV